MNVYMLLFYSVLHMHILASIVTMTSYILPFSCQNPSAMRKVRRVLDEHVTQLLSHVAHTVMLLSEEHGHVISLVWPSRIGSSQ